MFYGEPQNLAASMTFNFEIPVTIPDGYRYDGIVEFSTGSYHAFASSVGYNNGRAYVGGKNSTATTLSVTPSVRIRVTPIRKDR